MVGSQTATVGLPHRWRIVDPAEAVAAGVEPSALHAADGAVECRDVNAWVEEAVAPGWIAAYRLVAQGGRPVVAEVRVFPDLWGQGDRPLGIWSGEYLGVTAPDVPQGGIGAKVVRSARVGHALRAGARSLKRLRRAFPIYFEGASPMGRFVLQRTGQHRVGDADLARIAKLYTDLGCSPRAVARKLGWKESLVRSRLILARQRRLLTTRGKRGVGGGELTPAARQALTASRRPLRNHRKEKTR